MIILTREHAQERAMSASSQVASLAFELPNAEGTIAHHRWASQGSRFVGRPYLAIALRAPQSVGARRVDTSVS